MHSTIQTLPYSKLNVEIRIFYQPSKKTADADVRRCNDRCRPMYPWFVICGEVVGGIGNSGPEKISIYPAVVTSSEVVTSDSSSIDN